MKEVKTFIIADFIILLLKLGGGFLTKSYTMMTSSVFDLSLILVSFVTLNIKDDKKYKGILSSFIGFLLIILGIGAVFCSFVFDIWKTSLWIILFVVLSVVIRYVISCYYTNLSYSKKTGLLSYGNINSTLDFVNYGIIIGVLILVKVSKWVDIFKYADRVGTVLIACLVIYKGFKIIVNSFKHLEDKIEEDKEKYIEEIKKRNEVKRIASLDITRYGGIRLATCSIELNDKISMVDVNTFVVTLQDYLLKTAEAVKINLVEKKAPVKKKVKVRSLKQDARNSRGGNSKTNTKKKNTKQKNKKR